MKILSTEVFSDPFLELDQEKEEERIAAEKKKNAYNDLFSEVLFIIPFNLTLHAIFCFFTGEPRGMV